MMASTLLRASLDGAIVVAAVWILTRTVALTPATRTILWWCAAAKFVLALAWIAPIELPILPAEPPRSASAAAATTGAAIERAVPSTDVYDKVATRVSSRVAPRVSDRALPLRSLGEWSSFAALAWLGGLLLVALVAIQKWRATTAILRASLPASPETLEQARDLAARLNLKRVPAVRMSDRVETPLVAGLGRPVILLPAARFASLTHA